MNKDLIPDQVPYDGGAMSPSQLLNALTPNECYILLNPRNHENLVCQLARSSDGVTWYVAGPRFNGDEIVNLSNLMLAGEIDLYNKLHEDNREQQIYACSNPEEARTVLDTLFQLFKLDLE